MKVTLKDLLRHKFPMDETEQAVLLKEISDLAKELREKLRHYEFEGQNWELQRILKEILGES